MNKLNRNLININFIFYYLTCIVAEKPHSADTYWFRNTYNIMRTSIRSSLDVLKYTLYIKFNMNTMSHFNPIADVIQWLKLKNQHSKIHSLMQANSQKLPGNKVFFSIV